MKIEVDFNKNETMHSLGKMSCIEISSPKGKTFFNDFMEAINIPKGIYDKNSLIWILSLAFNCGILYSKSKKRK